MRFSGYFTDGIKKNFTPQDIRFTTANGYLYAIVLRSSENGDYVINSLGIQPAYQRDNFSGIIKSVTVLGTDENPNWERLPDGLHIKTNYKNSGYPIVFKIDID